MTNHLLSVLIFLPVVSAAIIILGLGKIPGAARHLAKIILAVEFLLSCFLLSRTDVSSTALQFTEKASWMSSFRIQYFVGIDGTNLPLIVLSAFVFLLCAQFAPVIKKGEAAFYTLFMALETTVLGLFCSQDLFLFFTFWTAMILPIYFLVSYWGGKNKDNAAARFFMSQITGCLFFIVGMFAVYYQSSPHTFDLTELVGGKFSNAVFDFGNKQFHFEKFIFWIFFLSFALRMPIAPIHGWFIRIQSEATTVLSVIMTAVVIKTGMYALIKINYPIFSSATTELANVFLPFAVINIIYGTLCSLSQKEIKKMISYSIICSNGIILFGFSSFTKASVQGAYLQMILSGLVFGSLAFLTEALSSRNTSDQTEIKFEQYGGLFHSVPTMTFFFTLALFSLIGFPGFGAFISQAMILLGGFESHMALTITASVGMLITASYLLWMYRNVFLGNTGETGSNLTDLTLRESISIAPLIILSIVFGLLPGALLSVSSSSLDRLLEMLGNK